MKDVQDRFFINLPTCIRIKLDDDIKGAIDALIVSITEEINAKIAALWQVGVIR